jgi:hypothetical protein
MQAPNKKRRKALKNKLKEEEAKKWAVESEEIKNTIADLADNIELKDVYSSDRITCDAIFLKLESMLAKKEIEILGRVLNYHGDPVEFYHLESGQKWAIRFEDNMRSGYCELKGNVDTAS